MLSDVGKHDRRKDRQQLLEQSAVASAAAGQRTGDLGDVVAAEDLRDGLLAVLLIDLVEAHTAVEQAAGGVAVSGGLDFARVIGVLRILLQSADQHRDQQLNRFVYFGFVDADLACDITRGNLSEKIFKARHGPVHLTSLGWFGSVLTLAQPIWFDSCSLQSGPIAGRTSAGHQPRGFQRDSRGREPRQ